MSYPASEKLEIIRLVERSHLPTRRTLDKLGIPRTTFYRWNDRYLAGGPEALEDRSPKARWYFRRPGYPRRALPGLPRSPEFMAEYSAAMNGRKTEIGQNKVVSGSVAALIAS